MVKFVTNARIPCPLSLDEDSTALITAEGLPPVSSSIEDLVLLRVPLKSMSFILFSFSSHSPPYFFPHLPLTPPTPGIEGLSSKHPVKWTGLDLPGPA